MSSPLVLWVGQSSNRGLASAGPLLTASSHTSSLAGHAGGCGGRLVGGRTRKGLPECGAVRHFSPVCNGLGNSWRRPYCYRATWHMWPRRLFPGPWKPPSWGSWGLFVLPSTGQYNSNYPKGGRRIPAFLPPYTRRGKTLHQRVRNLSMPLHWTVGSETKIRGYYRKRLEKVSISPTKCTDIQLRARAVRRTSLRRGTLETQETG